MGTNDDSGDRLEAVQTLVNGLKAIYPDAKKLHVDIHFEWVETEFYTDGAELCPVVHVVVER